MSDGKKLVWVKPELAEQIEALEDGREIERLTLKYIEDSRKSIELDVRALDEDVIRYKGIMIKARQAFEAACDEAEEKSYAVWEKYDKRDLSFKKVQEVRESLAPVLEDVKALNAELAKINLYDIERLITLLSQLETLSDGSREILAGMFDAQRGRND